MKDKTEILDKMINILCKERNEKPLQLSESKKFDYFRALVNVRPPLPASKEFLLLQDEYLQSELESKGITSLESLAPLQEDIYLWRGDITTLKCDGIVNAANSQMLGCFCPNHGCIDNAIHTFAGVQLRLECAKLMQEQKHEEPAGRAKLTKAYNLPCKYILHTVGPIVYNELNATHERLLADCYLSCLTLADGHDLQSLAFCCISTGEFRFPNKRAAEIAIQTVKEYKQKSKSKIKIIFNVFKEVDYEIYSELLKTNR